MVGLTARRIKTKFEKLKGENCPLKLWEELNTTQQGILLRGFVLEPDEVPVVGMPEGKNPLAITTKRIIWKSENANHCLEFGAIEEVRAPGYLSGANDWVDSRDSIAAFKGNLRQLMVKTTGGMEYFFETEPGAPLFVLWNLLLNVIPSRKKSEGTLSKTRGLTNPER